MMNGRPPATGLRFLSINDSSGAMTRIADAETVHEAALPGKFTEGRRRLCKPLLAEIATVQHRRWTFQVEVPAGSAT
jgi:hypothetical protein